MAQRGGETLLGLAPGDVAGERFAIDDRGEDAAIGAHFLERVDLRPGPARCGGGRRTEHDQEARTGKRVADVAPEVGRGGKLVAVAEDRHEARRDHAIGGVPPHQVAGNAVFLERFVKPVRGLGVAMPVAEKGAVAKML